MVNTRRQGCPDGMVHRKSYTRKNGVFVKSACVPQTSRRVCPPGKILRAAYTRRIYSRVRTEGYNRTTKSGKKIHVVPKAVSKHVAASCVKDVKARKGLIGPLRKGELRKHGYSYKLPEHVRRMALKKAVSEFGAMSTYRKLNAVAKLTGSSVPKASEAFSSDRDWIRNVYGKNGHLKE